MATFFGWCHADYSSLSFQCEPSLYSYLDEDCIVCIWAFWSHRSSFQLASASTSALRSTRHSCTGTKTTRPTTSWRMPSFPKVSLLKLQLIDWFIKSYQASSTTGRRTRSSKVISTKSWCLYFGLYQNFNVETVLSITHTHSHHLSRARQAVDDDGLQEAWPSFTIPWPY